MTANRKSLSPLARYLFASVAMALFGLTWGCGSSDVPQTPMDAKAEARVKEVVDAQKKAMERRKPLVKPGVGPQEPKAAQ
jgi:hypothetical protein